LPTKDRQDVALLIRMRPREMEALRELAAAVNVTVGVYAREVLRARIRRTSRIR